MDSLQPEPTIIAEGFGGYQHFVDITHQPFNTLTYPSTNCTIPSNDRIDPDKGKTLLGQTHTQNVPIIGNKEKFTTMGGKEVEVRVWPSEQYITYSSLVGTFAPGETITGGTSSNTAVIVSKDTGVLILKTITGPFTIGETVTGATSAATATVVLDRTAQNDVIEVLYTDENPSGTFYNTEHWYPITQIINPLAYGVHRYSFDQWFDTNLNPANSLNLTRLIWVNGNTKVYSWTGGIAPIVSLVANTSITTTTGVSWTSLGFVSPARGGSGNIIINGLAYAITGGWDTDTLTLSSTSGITVGNMAFAQIEQDDTTSTGTVPFDFCRQSKGYMFYGNWNDRQLYMSNAYNRPATLVTTAVQAAQNDLIVGNNAYSGTGQHVYRVTISAVNPPVNQQSFSGSGLNDAIFQGTGSVTLPSGYSGTAGALNTYKIACLADLSLVAAVGGGTLFTVGDTVIGTTSGATGTIVAIINPGLTPTYGLKMSTDFGFKGSEIITASSTAYINNVTQSLWQTWVQFLKNNVVIPINTGSGPLDISNVNTVSAVTLTDGIEIKFANFQGHTPGDVFQLLMNQGGHDTFQWQIDGAAPTTGVAITGGTQTLSNGVQISFVSKTGHSVGDYWDITASQAITEAWHNYYYTIPVRKPGEGYIYRLPSNFWTMDTQEDKLYVNCQYGEWGVITTELSADLQSESIGLDPLKQTGALKVIDPWMTGHTEDDLVFVTLDKHLIPMGRKQFLQEPQSGYLSDPVKLDFLESSFVGGGIKYIGKKLYITSPEQGIMHVYDTAKGYWQPPKTFPEMGIPTIVGNKLAMHSNIRNQSFTMFTNTSDNGQDYTVVMRTPATAYFKMVNKHRIPARWTSKFSSASFIEGYIKGNPELFHTVYLGVNGCGGEFPHTVQPIVCVQPDRAPFGEGELGSHSNGSDVGSDELTYFNEFFRGYRPILSYYFISLGITCTSRSHTYAILSMGMNMSWSPSGNNDFINRDAELL